MLIRKAKKNKVFQLLAILITNIIFLTLLHLVEDYFNLNKAELKNEEDILNHLAFYSLVIIVIAPILEELLYRLPLKRSKFAFFSLLVGIINILIIDLLILKIALALYLVGVVYLMYLKKKITFILIPLSIILFTVSHVGNYNIEDLELMNSLDIFFLFLPQLVLGIIVTFIRLKSSFKYALLYHSLYNSTVLFLAIMFD